MRFFCWQLLFIWHLNIFETIDFTESKYFNKLYDYPQ